MGKFNVSDLFLYRYRYLIGYGLIAIGLIAVLIFAGMFLPGGLSTKEIESVVHSTSITLADFWSVDAIDLPYSIIQHASLAIFGASVFSMKLPSLIFAFFSAFGLVLLLRQWFRPRIAVLASLIILTTGQFLYIAQNATPEIMLLFWPIWILLIASLIPNVDQKYRKYLKAAFFVFAAFSLYTPLSAYVLLVIVGAVALHPHLRYTFKQMSAAKLAIGSAILIAITLPLIVTIAKNPSVGLTLLGIPLAPVDLWHNLTTIVSQYLGLFGNTKTNYTSPFFELGSILLILLGVYYVIRTRVTAKSYVVVMLTLVTIVLVILNPVNIAILFLPMAILLASGLNGLLSHWYGLFPRNPYARIGGLIPLVILVFILVSSGMDRYIYSYTYDPKIVPNFSKDIQLLPTETKNIIVAPSEVGFYKVIAEYNGPLGVHSSPQTNLDEFVATRKAKSTISGYEVDKIITSPLKNDSDRFYLYKKVAR